MSIAFDPQEEVGLKDALIDNRLYVVLVCRRCIADETKIAM